MTVHRRRDDSELPAKKRKTFETNIFKFFLERAPISNFCCATNQNNPHIKYVSCDRPHLLKPCGKYFSWAPPLPFRNFYPLAPPPQPLGISISHPWGGGGMDIFWNHIIVFIFLLHQGFAGVVIAAPKSTCSFTAIIILLVIPCYAR